MAFVFSGRASRRECLSVFLSMTLADCLGLAVAQILLGLALPLLMPGVDVFSCLSFISRFLGLLLVLLIVLQSFALCWRRLHDLSLAGWWSFALPFVFLAGSLSVEWFLGHLFRSDTWGMFVEHAREVLEQWRQEEWRWQFSCCQEPGLLRCWACFPVRRRKINTVILRRYDRSVSRTEKNRGFFPSPEREDNIDKPRNACLTERAFP